MYKKKICILLIIFMALCSITGCEKIVSNVKKGEANYLIEYTCEECSDFAVDGMKVGDDIIDEPKGIKIGVVNDLKTDEAVSYTMNADGEIVVGEKENYKSVVITTTVYAEKTEYGIHIGDVNYSVGHSVAIKVGKSRVLGRISKIEKIRE